MERWYGTVAVVTGASGGIGAAITKALALKGLQVVGLARRIEKLNELACSIGCEEGCGKIHPMRCDITNEEAVLKTFKNIGESLGPIHILVNNAGLTRPTSLADGVTDEWRRIFDVNVIAMCVCTREAVKQMRANNIDGQIVNINSISGHYVPNTPVPSFNVYPASKFAVTALTESLRQELRYLQTKIKVTSISPGVVRTDFQDGLPDDALKEALVTQPALKAEDVAGAVVYAIGTPPDVQVQELTIRPVGELF